MSATAASRRQGVHHPVEGRLEAGGRRRRPASADRPRSQCIALDGVLVADGRYDEAVIMLGGIWDYAPTQVIVEERAEVLERGGDRRLETATGVFTTPGSPTTSSPSSPSTAPMSRTRRSSARPPSSRSPRTGRTSACGRTSMSARRHVEHAPPFFSSSSTSVRPSSPSRSSGITTDGLARPGSINGGPSRRFRPPRSPSPPWPSSSAFAEPPQPGDVRDGRHRVAAVVRRPHGPLADRPDARGPRASAAGCGARHRAGDPVRARIRAGAEHHADRRAASPS